MIKTEKPSLAVKNKKGFTLVELIIVLAVILILAAVSVSVYTGVVARANEAVLKTNTTTVKQLIALYGLEYDKEKWYGSWSADGDETLNNRVELELEIMISGHYANDISLKNPYSGKKSVLDYDKTLSSGDGYCPAVFLTANNSYAHTGTGSTKNLIGTIVAYFKTSGGTTEYIEIYFINKNGTKSSPAYIR